MATKRSKNTMEQRARTYDRITTLIDKGGSNLVRALALRENVSIAELMRRAILARAGLRLLPYPDKLEELAHVKDQESAKKEIRSLQTAEISGEIVRHVLEELAAEPPAAAFVVQSDDVEKDELRFVLKRISDAAEQPGAIKLSGMEVGTLRRFLANIEKPQDIVAE